MDTPSVPTRSSPEEPSAARRRGSGARAPCSTDATVVREEAVPGFPAVHHPGWSRAFPWLVQGTTTRWDPSSEDGFDLRLFGSDRGAPGARDRWDRLLEWSRAEAVAHARQVHGATVLAHEFARRGLHVGPDADGHATGVAGLLLAVSVADCVPVSIVDAERRAVAMLHAGWRGAAAGILEVGLAALTPEGGPDRLHVHFGPAICGRCYEVGPEVFEALGYVAPDAPTPIDLRAALADRARAAGVSPDRMSMSAHCTRCGEAGLFFSHRGGDAGRQVGFVGVRG